MPKTTKFSELVERTRKNNPDWGANVGEYRRAMEDALALADLRQSRNITQIQLAAQLGITQGSVSRMEGRSEIYLSTLRSYIEALGRPPGDRRRVRRRPRPGSGRAPRRGEQRVLSHRSRVDSCLLCSPDRFDLPGETADLADLELKRGIDRVWPIRS